MVFRYCGCERLSLTSVALGRVGGHISLGVSNWDLVGALVILVQLGRKSTLDWASEGLMSKFAMAVARPSSCPSPQGFYTQSACCPNSIPRQL